MTLLCQWTCSLVVCSSSVLPWVEDIKRLRCRCWCFHGGFHEDECGSIFGKSSFGLIGGRNVAVAAAVMFPLVLEDYFSAQVRLEMIWPISGSDVRTIGWWIVCQNENKLCCWLFECFYSGPLSFIHQSRWRQVSATQGCQFDSVDLKAPLAKRSAIWWASTRGPLRYQCVRSGGSIREMTTCKESLYMYASVSLCLCVNEVNSWSFMFNLIVWVLITANS